ncbi:MAG: hypothetical protein DGJ47_000873 [Rickettsiaceae bacterium]
MQRNIFTKNDKKPKLLLWVIGISLIISALILSYRQERVYTEDNTPLKTQNIVLYVKEGCIYCKLAKELLDSQSYDYDLVELANNRDLHLKMIEKTGQTTVPYIFINNELIGGYSDLKRMNDRNKL